MLPGTTVFAAELLHAKTTTGQITTVARGTACFLLCHLILLLRLGGRGFSLGSCGAASAFFALAFFFLSTDRGDLQDRVLLAMAVLAAIIVATLLLEDDDLVGLRLRDDLGGDRQALDRLQLEPSPASRTSASVIDAPASPSSFSTTILSPAAPRYCLPPVRTTANMASITFQMHVPAQACPAGEGAQLQGDRRFCCQRRIALPPGSGATPGRYRRSGSSRPRLRLHQGAGVARYWTKEISIPIRVAEHESRCRPRPA